MKRRFWIQMVGKLQSDHWPQPNFVRGARRLTAPMALVLVVASAGLVLGGVRGRDAWQGLAQAVANKEAAEHMLLAARGQRKAPTAPHTPAADAIAATEARKLVQGLRPAWSASFLDIEGVGSPELRWLGLDMDAESGAVQMSGEASGIEPILGAMERLSRQPGWRDLTLSRLKMPNNLDRASWVQFELHAQFGAGTTP